MLKALRIDLAVTWLKIGGLFTTLYADLVVNGDSFVVVPSGAVGRSIDAFPYPF